MKLKTSFSDYAKIQFRRQWWIMGLFAFVMSMALPVALLLRLGNMEDISYTLEYKLNYFNMFLLRSESMIRIAMVGGALTALYQFRYLHSRKMVDFYHSLPIRREKQYSIHVVTAYLYFLIPLTIWMAACMIIGGMRGLMTVEAVPIYLAGWLIMQVFFLVYYGAAIVGMMLTGREFVGVLGTIMILFLPGLVSGISNMLHSQFFDTYVHMGMGSLGHANWLVRLSPGLSVWELWEMVIELFDKFSCNTVGFITQIVIVLVYMVGFLVLGYYLLKRRSSEAAGNSIAFEIPCRVYHVVISIVGALYCGMIFYSLANYDSLLWLYGGTLLGGMVLYVLIQFIYTIDIRKTFMYKWQIILVETAALIIMAVFYFDWIGFDTYIPDKEHLYSVALSINDGNQYQPYQVDGIYMDGEDYRMEYMNLDVTDELYEMLEEAIETTERYYESVNSEAVPYDSGSNYTSLKTRYKLENGRWRNREYRIELENYRDLFASLYDQAEFKNKMMPMYEMFPVDDKYEISLNYEDEYMKLFGDEKEVVKEFIQVLKHSFEETSGWTLVNEIPIAEIRVVSDTLGYSYDGLPVYASNAELISYLAEHGYELKSSLTTENIIKIVVEDSRGTEEIENTVQGKPETEVLIDAKTVQIEPFEPVSKTYTEKEDIEKILPALINESYSYEYIWIDTCDNLYAVVTYQGKDGYQKQLRFAFVEDKLPEFLK